MIIGKFLQSKKLQNFYIYNFPSLIYEYNRPFLLSLLWMTLEYIEYLMIMFDQDLVNTISKKDPQFEWIKSTTIMSRNSSYALIITYIFLAFNSLILLYLLILYAIYCRKEFKFYKSTLFSIIIQLYTAVLVVPSFAFSAASKSPVGVVNIILTFIISFINCLHHQKLSFTNVDSLSQRASSLVGMFKIFLIFIGIIMRNFIQSNNIFPVFPLILSIFGLVKFWWSFPYIDQRINRIFLYLNIFNFLTSIIIIIYINTSVIVSIFFQIFIIPILAFKLSQRYYNYKVEFIKNLFYLVPLTLNYETDVPQYAIDFLIRDLANKSRFSELTTSQIHDHKNELIQDELLTRHMKNCVKTPYCQCEGIRSGIDNDLKIAISEIFEKRREVIDQEILQIFENYLKTRKNLSYVHISYLYFLHDRVKNYLLINTQIYEMINQKKQNLLSYDIAHLKYLLYKNISAQELNSNLQIDKVFKYEEKIKICQYELTECILQKLDILKYITEDLIDIQALEKKVTKFLKGRKLVEQSLIEVLEANQFCSILQNMITIFQLNISFYESKEIFQKKQKQFKSMKKLNESLFKKNAAVIFVSLLNSSFGLINQVSKNFEHIFEITPKNIIGYNCNLLMPSGVSLQHNNILKRYISKGTNQSFSSFDQQPILAQNKSGFIFQISKQYQIYTSLKNELGLIGLITMIDNYKKQDFLIINLKQLPLKIEACSQNIHQRIFQKYIGPNKEYQNILLSRIFPTLPYIVQNSSNKKKNQKPIKLLLENETDEPKILETFGFFPDREQQESLSNFAKKQQFSNGGNLHTLMEQGEFSFSKNKIFLIRFKLWYINDEFLDQCTIQIEMIKHLIPETIINSYHEQLLIEQLKKYCSLSYSINQLRQYLQGDQFQSSQKIDFVNQQQSYPHLSLEQTTFDIFRQSKNKELVIFNELNQSEGKKSQSRNSKLLKIQNELLHNNDSENVENSANHVFSLSTFHSPRFIKNGDQNGNLLVQNTPRTTDREFLLSNNGKNNHVDMPELQMQLQPYAKQSLMQDVESEHDKDQNQKDQYQSSDMQTMNQYSTQRKTIMNNNIQSVSTSINSQFKGQKLQIYNTFKSIKQPFFFLMVKYLSMICLATLLILILVVFVDLKKQFDLNTKNFYYISWGNNLRVQTSKIFKSYLTARLLDNDIYGYTNDPNKQLYQHEQLTNGTQAFKSLQSYLSEIINEKTINLSFMDIITEHKTNILFSYSTTKSVNITAYGIYILYINSQYLYQYGSMKQYSPLIEYNAYSNFLNIANLLSVIQNSQQQSVTDTFNQIKLEILLMLICIVSICAVFVLFVFPAYTFSQSYKQKIYSLFSTIDIIWIREMHRNLLFCLSNISDKNSVQIQTIRRYQSSELLNKKKSISSTTTLSKFSIKIVFFSLILYVILIIYPIVNLIITNNLIDQQNNNQNLQGAIQNTKAAFMSTLSIYELYANSLLNPGEENLQKSYQERYTIILKQAMQAFDGLLQVVQKQVSQNRYQQNEYDQFLFPILKSNACDPISNYPQYVISGQTNFDQHICNTLIDGQLSKGLTTALLYYYNILNNIFLLHQIQDPVSRNQQIKQYLQKYRLLELNTSIDYIENILNIINDFVYTNSKDFFNYMTDIQTILLLYQFGVLITVNQLALILFFNSIQNTMNDSKNALTILEIRYIIESPYIMSFINQKQ
ncbi:transmembrane protein, putative (macronuclear) [Tetrahymena thermophila SB210]|uniref:Transmembrane protein, putative n=1 Tax=Tetrahymena thermophila (strain SB210) TaxID=312017 RepID=Q22P57_TETTS|nr:transmembrane protein, putative [Tetrahymena thermophila SB210]EAR86954.2 transmembrane protein, putative [Tetrahymena thermophila SB210]|eukprot:XP_001007199.2 transmembrane protein, putative [Tetrahymena thermophila SB210]